MKDYLFVKIASIVSRIACASASKSSGSINDLRTVERKKRRLGGFCWMLFKGLVLTCHLFRG